ncbi:MAG: cysteinyl-tRNA synthetase, partial [Paracoccaceae bacterium]
HGGGNDLQFPHHENEIAQSCCAHPQGVFAQVWMHNEMLQVEGRKMSKSLGNFFTVRDLLDQGYEGEVIRFVFLSTHYRKPMDWTDEKARETGKTLAKWRGLVAGIEPATRPAPSVLSALSDDVNTPGAIAALHELAQSGDFAGLKASAQLMGLLSEQAIAQGDPALERVAALIDAARTARDYARSDALRDAAVAAGAEVKISKQGAVVTATGPVDHAALEAIE